MKAYIDGAHAKNMKVKIYNTVRELSNSCTEIFALRSLNGEIFSKVREVDIPGFRNITTRITSLPGLPIMYRMLRL